VSVGDVIMRCAAVAVGGALGSLGRYGLSVWGATLGGRVPWGTFAANAIGCLAMGVVMHGVTRSGSEGWRLFVAVGVLGGLTTFSTFSHEVVTLGRQGHIGAALVYTGASVVAGLGLAGVGWWAAGLFWR
jgi:fluoride exporter